MRIGILTFFASINYGAFLQAYSLQQVLLQRYAGSAVVEMIGYDSDRAHNLYSHWGAKEDVDKYASFVSDWKYLNLTEKMLISDNIEEISRFISEQDYDIVISGSDEVFKTDGMRGFPNAYWLNYDIGKAKRFAYAVSGRNNYLLHEETERKYIKSALEQFFFLGTRDEITRKELGNFTDRSIYMNCDPCFLLADFWAGRESVFRKYKGVDRLNCNKDLPDKKVVLVMTADYKIAKVFREMYSSEFVVVGNMVRNKSYTDEYIYDFGPFRWADYFSKIDFMITDFFHGTVFSIINNVPFISIERVTRGRSKIENLLREHDMENRLLYLEDYSDGLEKLVMTLRGMMDGIMDEPKALCEEIVKKEQAKAESFFEAIEKAI